MKFENKNQIKQLIIPDPKLPLCRVSDEMTKKLIHNKNLQMEEKGESILIFLTVRNITKIKKCLSISPKILLGFNP